jgi:putative acyl-CoA dehydrogenase
VKGQNRHFDRSWRQLQQRLRKPQEEWGRNIAKQLANLATGAQLLPHLSPPLAEAWCRMALDERGESVLPEAVLTDVLLRATGRTA